VVKLFMARKHLTAGFIGILSLIALLLILVFLNPFQVNSALEFISRHPITGAVFLILLRTLSSIFPVIPGGIIIFAAVPLLGWFTAFVCNATGLLLGKSAAFFLARIYREPLVKRFVSLKKIHEAEKKLTGKKQFAALVAFKLFTVPVVDISSYIVGLTKISYSKFSLATFIAALPTIISFYFGNEIYKRIFGNNLVVGIAAILIAGIIYLIIRYGFKPKTKNLDI
jgi:uncharacterized membrane protein YdjX (TVP38/TMEM64 family)